MKNIIDKYPSRCENPSIVNRQDPITTENIKFPKPLSKKEIEQYRNNGYLLSRNLFSYEEIETIKNNIYDLRDYYETLDFKNLDEQAKSKLVSENNDSKNEFIKSIILKSIWQVHLPQPFSSHLRFASNLCYDLVRDCRILDRTRQIIGEDVYIHQSRINFQKGWNGETFGSGFLWHQDFEQWHCDDGMPQMKALSAALLLEDTTPQNGALMVIPKSHKFMIQSHVPANNYDNFSEKALSKGPRFPVEHLKKAADESGIEYCSGKAGDLVLFDCNILHGSHTNISPWGRCMIFFVYNSVNNTLIDKLRKGDKRPEYISCTDQKFMGKALESVNTVFDKTYRS